MDVTGRKAHKKNVYLTQFNTATERNLLPLATGLLAAYLKKNPAITNQYKLNIQILRDDPSKIVNEYDDPFLLAYSNYFWNHHYSLHIAKLAKQKYPNSLIVFGGPSVPIRESEVEEFFNEYPFVDIIVPGEGEIILCDILEALMNDQKLESIPGISLNLDNKLVYQEQRKPIKDFSNFPSPFLDGTFDDLLQRHSEVITGVVWESNRGCPFTCSFCYWGGAEKRVVNYSEERVYRELDWIAENEINYIFGADANFGMRKRDVKIAQYIADLNIRTGYPKFFVINWNKNSTDKIFTIIDALNESEVSFMLTVSVQSFNAATLEAVNRKNIKTEHFHNILKEAKKRNFNTYTELILGLPLESYATFKDGLRNILVNNLNYYFAIYPCVMIPGTEMSTKAYFQKYGIETRRCKISLAKTVTMDYGFTEYEDIIVGTSTMDVGDWQKSYVIGFFVKSLYGFRLVYHIFNYLRDKHQIDLMDLFEYIIQSREEDQCGSLNSYLEILFSISHSILQGDGVETITIDETEAALLPEMAVLIKILVDKKNFYSNLEKLLARYLTEKNCSISLDELSQLVLYQNLVIPSFNGVERSGAVFSFHEIKEYFNIESDNVMFLDEEYTNDVDEFILTHTYSGMVFKLNRMEYLESDQKDVIEPLLQNLG